MNIAIIGDGLLGRTVKDECDRRGLTSLVLGHDFIEITDPDSCARALEGYDVAVNTAAFHRLAECEADPDRAYLVNATGARNVARVLPTAYISTDYVFDVAGPHDEVLPGSQPRSIYGRSKLAGELQTLEMGGLVVRVAGLYGHYPSHKGETFPERVMGSWDPMRVPDDQRLSPSYAPDAAGRIVDIVTATEPAGIYHATGQGSATWAEFALSIIEVTGHKRAITSYAAKDPLRPRNSVLRSTRLPPLRHWRFALAAWADRWKADHYVSPLRGEA